MMTDNYAEALRRIEAARITSNVSLNLSWLKLTTLPNEILQLTHLMALNAYGNQLTDITLLSNLNHLVELWLSNNQLTDITPLMNLNQLTSLWLDDNQLSDISPLSNLNQLAQLWLSGNQLNDIKSLSNLKQLTELKLNWNKLTDITPLVNLTQLKWLLLGNNQLIDINVLSNLNELEKLDLSDNQLTNTDVKSLSILHKLTDLKLSGNQLKCIRFLSSFNGLETIELDRNQLTDIASLSHLSNLKTIYLSNNQLTDITPLANLYQLKYLYLSYNQIKNIISLSNLNQLRQLIITNNRLTDIKPLANLKQLASLSLDNNQLSDLMPLRQLIQKINVTWLRTNLYEANIFVAGNPLICPPREIVENGKGAIEEYFTAIDKSGKKPIGEARVLIVGEGQSGKTTLLKKLINANYVVSKTIVAQTEGIQIQKDWKIKSTKYKAHLWDFGGQEIQYKTHQLFLSGRCVYVLLTNGRQEVNHNFRYWLHAIQLFGQNPDGSYHPVLVLNNAHGNGAVKQLPLDDWKKKFPELHIQGFDVNLADPNPTAFKRFRAALGDNLQQLPHLKAELPVQWLDIKKALERARQKRNHLTEKEFYQICAKSDLTAEPNLNVFSDYLHDLGLILRFRHDIQLRDFVVLNPEWAVNAMYSILTQRKIQEVNKGRFTEADVFEGWQQYSFTERTHLLRLMGKDAFDICYPLSNGVYIAPQLLDNQPPTYPKKWSSDALLKFRLTYDFMPKGILSRFSVREHAFIARNAAQQQVIWSKGVLLEMQDCYVEVIERDYDIEGSIEIAVQGDVFQSKKVLAQVVESLKVVNKRWWANVKQEVPCGCKQCRKSLNPHFFQLSYLDERLKVGKNQVECMISPFEAVEIKAVLAGVMEAEEVNARLRSNPAFAKRFRMDEFRQWVQKDKIEKAFELFDYESFMDKEDRNMFVQLQARYKSFQKEKRSGTESFETLERMKRKLISDSLNWTSDLEDE